MEATFYSLARAQLRRLRESGVIERDNPLRRGLEAAIDAGRLDAREPQASETW